MRNEPWSEMDRICTKKLSERYFMDKITDRNPGDYSLPTLLRNDQNYGPQLLMLEARI
jgi:hypothetical protein